MRKGFVLLVGDDGVVLCRVPYASQFKPIFCASPEDPSFGTLMQALAAQPGLPISVLVDALEQSYRTEGVPKVGLFDQAKIVRRRLEVAFPNGHRAYLALTPPAGRGERRYLFASLPSDGPAARWRTALGPHARRIANLCLLPVESAHLAEKLTPASQGEAGSQSWKMLISPSLVGGYRQIVVRGGELAFTRLTRQSQGDPAETAENIARELRASMGYLARMGFSGADTLDVVVLGSAEVGAALRDIDCGVRSINVVTPHEAARAVGISGIGQDVRFGDLLHIAHFASRSPVLDFERQGGLLTEEAEHFIASWGARAAALACAASGSYAIFLGYAWAAMALETEQMQSALDATKRRTEVIEQELKQAPVPYDAFHTIVNSYDELSKNSGARPFFVDLGDILPANMTLASTTWKSAAVKVGRPDSGDGREAVSLQVDVVPAGNDPQDAVAAADRLIGVLKARYPAAAVDVKKMPIAIMPKDTFRSRTEPVFPLPAPVALRFEVTVTGGIK